MGSRRRQRADVVAVSFGTLGDVLPFVGLGAELRRRGRDVTLISNAAPEFERRAREAGLEFVGLGTRQGYRRAVNDPDLWHPRRGLKTVVDGLLPEPLAEYRAVTASLRPGGVAVAHPFGFGARVAQDKHGIDCVTAVLSTCWLRSDHRVPVMVADWEVSQMAGPLKRLMWWLADRLLIDPAVKPGLDRACRQLDLPRIDRPFDGWIFSPLQTVGMFPEWFAPRQPDWPEPLELTGFVSDDGEGEPREDVEEFVEAGSAPVVVTAGSAKTEARRFVEPVLEACRNTGRRLLVAGLEPSRMPAEAAGLDDRGLAVEFVRYDAVLERCAAIVHHGGIGTTAAALRAGIPQIVRPIAHDHPDHAARIRRLGVGRRLTGRQFGPVSVAEALDELIGDDETTAACIRCATRVRENDALAEAVDVIEAVTE